MGLSALKGTTTGEYLYTCIPREIDIQTAKIYEEYTLITKPRYMSTLGTMCDYGVRSRFPNRDFGYIEMGLIQGAIDTEASTIITEEYLTADMAHFLATNGKAKISQAMYTDYVNITDRAGSMYSLMGMVKPYFGKFYKADGILHSFECDCASDSTIVDMKVSRTSKHNRSYWMQVLAYSLLAHRRDKQARTRISLLYPVQGEIKYFNYTSPQYSAMSRAFNEIYEEEIVCM